jgi:chromosomal replication initiation ATPase DnaA
MKAMAMQPRQQTEALFNEINKLIQRTSFSRAILQLKLLNSGNDTSEDIEIYDYIIASILDEYHMEARELFDGNGKGESADARRSAYVFIRHYLGFSQESIAVQFNKERTTVTMALTEFKKMKNEAKFYQIYFERHERLSRGIEKYLTDIKS